MAMNDELAVNRNTCADLRVVEPYAGLGECHRLTPMRPDGPKLEDGDAERWEEHVARRLECGRWQMCVDDLREWLEIGEKQRRFRVDWERIWPDKISGPSITGDAVMIASRRVGIWLRGGVWSRAARALEDAAATARELEAEIERRASLVAIHGHLPPDEIHLADVITDTLTLSYIENSGCCLMSSLVRLTREQLRRIGVHGMRLERLIEALDAYHIRHGLSGVKLPTSA